MPATDTMSDKVRQRAVFSDSSSDEDEEYYSAPLCKLPREEEHRSQQTWTASQPAPEGIQTQPDQSYKIPRKGASVSSDEQSAAAATSKRRSPRNVSRPLYVPETVLADTPDSGTISSITNTISGRKKQNSDEFMSSLVQQREADLQPLKRNLVNATASNTGGTAPKLSISYPISPKETVISSARVSLSPAPFQNYRTTGGAKRSNSKNVISSLEALAPPPSDIVKAVTEAGLSAISKSSSPKFGGENQKSEDDDNSVTVLSVRKCDTKPPLKKRKMVPNSPSITAAGIVGEFKAATTKTSAVVEPLSSSENSKKKETATCTASTKEVVTKNEKPRKKARKKKASKFAVDEDEGVYFIEDELFIVDDEAPPPSKKRRFKLLASEENDKENRKPSAAASSSSSEKPKKAPVVDKAASKASIEQQEIQKSKQSAPNKRTKAKKKKATPFDTEKDLPKPTAGSTNGAGEKVKASVEPSAEAPAKSKKKIQTTSKSSPPATKTPNQEAISKSKSEAKGNHLSRLAPNDVEQSTKLKETDEATKHPSSIRNKKNSEAISITEASSSKKEASLRKDDEPSAPAVVVKKKKRSFQAEVLCEMLFSCKVYNLKTLAQVCQTTETVLQHLLLSLLDKKVVIQKDFTSKSGKSKILYWANQNSKAKEVMKLIPVAAEMQQGRQDLAALHKLNADNAKEMAILTQGLSNDEIEAQLLETEAAMKELKEKVIAVRTRIQNFKKGGTTGKPVIGNNRFQKPKSAAQLVKERCPRRTKIRINAMRGEWKSRKQKCIDFVDQLADGMEKKPKQVVQLLDLETDEMEGITEMPPKHVID